MYETESYETTSETLAFCKAYLEERRQLDAALCLEGLVSVCDQATAREARGRLVAAEKHVRDDSARHVIILAINAVERALGAPVLLATG